MAARSNPAHAAIYVAHTATMAAFREVIVYLEDRPDVGDAISRDQLRDKMRDVERLLSDIERLVR